MTLSIQSKLGNLWILKETDQNYIEAIQHTYKCSLLTAKYIANKKISFDQIPNFLNPILKNNWINTNTIPNIIFTTKTITEAIEKKQKIGIIGDYDVDGISSSVILSEFFEEFNIYPIIWIPNRKDGYGPSEAALKFFKKNPVDLLILVDCGTNAHEFHNNYKKPMLIIDHHHSLNPIKNCVINPNATIEFVNQELKELCATSLTFFIISHVLKHMQHPKYQKLMQNFLDLVTLATICDMMPLNNLNRALIKAGLKKLEQQERIGLRQLINFSNIKLPITTKDIGFIIGPRLNSTGRIESPEISLKLLKSKSFEECNDIIHKIERTNNYRKEIQQEAFQEAKELAKKDSNQILCIASENWDPGVVGIVAAMVQSEENKPTIIGNMNNEYVKASARSNSINIGILIEKAVELGVLESGGGHKAAAGLTCKKENWEIFIKWINEQTISIEQNTITVDMISTLTDIDNDYKKIAPFGLGNEEPKILVNTLHIAKILDKTTYIQVIIEESFKTFTIFINSSKAKLIEELNIIYSNRLTFSGIFSLQEKGPLILEDINFNK